MKFYERKLLDHLQATKSADVPLENIRKSLGAVSHMVGNPLSKTEITLNISIYFFNNVGAIVAPAALPVVLQTSLPVYFFGLTDYYGGFNKLRNIIPTNPGWFFITAPPIGFVATGIVNYNAIPMWPAALPFVRPGDLIIQYADNLVGFNWTAMIVIRCQNVAYGTFLNSFVSDLITLDTIRYIVPLANINQFINPVIFGYQTLFGKVSSDSIDPRLYITNKDFQQQIADLPINLPIDKNLMIGLQMDIFCPTFSWVLFVKKVEPLTHK